MALSSDPDKRARSLANLKRGKQPAAAPPADAPAAKDLPVVTFPEPGKPAAKAAAKKSSSKPPAAKASTEVLSPPEDSAGVPWLVIGGGIALVVLVLILSRTPGAPDA